jgi:hypothetical protein
MIGLYTPTLGDLMLLCSKARPDEIEQYEALVGEEWDTEKVAVDHWQRPGVKFVLVADGKPIVAGGFDPVIPGVLQSWMVGTMDTWESHWRSITKYSRRIMDELLESGARRLQTCVLTSRYETCEWYKRGLKMEFEGTFRRYGAHGESMDLYARIR